MPEDIIGGLNNWGMTLISGTAQAWMEGKRNKQMRAWQKADYERQRKDSLADWQMQADYNSPSAQMERLKAAGLNPNLVYGHGADAQMGSPPRGASMTGYRPSEGSPGIVSPGLSLDQYFNYQAKQAQIENMRAQNEVIKQEGLLKAFGLSRGQQMLDYDLQYKEASVWKLRNDATLSAQLYELRLEELEIVRATKPETIQKAFELVLNMRADRARTAEDTERIKHAAHVLMQSEELAQFEISMRAQNIMPGTPAWLRAFQLMWRNLLGK